MNLIFLKSAFLFGAIAVAIPVIIHLLSRRAREKYYFGSVYFLKEVIASRSKSLKLKNWILLLLRALMVAAVAFILAQPVLKSKVTSMFLKENTSANVIIFDTSMSMGIKTRGKSFLDLSKENFTSLVKTLDSNDSITIITAGEQPELAVGPFSNDFVAAKEFAGKLETGYGTADIKEAVNMACDLLKTSPAGQKRIFVFSDMQKISWDFFYKLDDDIAAFTFARKNPIEDNLSLYDSTIFSELIDPLEPVEISSSVGASKLVKIGKSSLKLFVERNLVEDRIISPIAHARIAEAFKLSLEEGQNDTWGYFQLEDDNFEKDNKRYFSIGFPRSISVLLVSSQHDVITDRTKLESFYLKEALNPVLESDEANIDPAESRALIDVNEVDAGELENIEFDKFDVVMVTAMDTLSNESLVSLAEFVKMGGNVVFFLSDKTPQDFFNSHFTADDVFGYKMFDHKIESLKVAVDKEDIFWGRNLENHPFFEGFDKYFDPFSVVFKKYFRVVAGEDVKDKVLASYSNSDPLMIETAFGKGKAVLVTFCPVKDWTNFPIQPTFLTFAHRLVLYLSGNLMWRPEQFEVGQKLVYRDKKLPEKISSLAITDTKGKVIEAINFEHKGNLLKADYVFDLPGVYSLVFNGNESQKAYAAVNFSARELENLDFFEKKDMQDKWGERLVVLDIDTKDFDNTISFAVKGTNLKKLLAVLLILFVLAETFLANRNRYVKAGG